MHQRTTINTLLSGGAKVLFVVECNLRVFASYFCQDIIGSNDINRIGLVERFQYCFSTKSKPIYIVSAETCCWVIAWNNIDLAFFKFISCVTFLLVVQTPWWSVLYFLLTSSDNRQMLPDPKTTQDNYHLFISSLIEILLLLPIYLDGVNLLALPKYDFSRWVCTYL